MHNVRPLQNWRGNDFSGERLSAMHRCKMWAAYYAFDIKTQKIIERIILHFTCIRYNVYPYRMHYCIHYKVPVFTVNQSERSRDVTSTVIAARKTNVKRKHLHTHIIICNNVNAICVFLFLLTTLLCHCIYVMLSNINISLSVYLCSYMQKYITITGSWPTLKSQILNRFFVHTGHRPKMHYEV